MTKMLELECKYQIDQNVNLMKMFSIFFFFFFFFFFCYYHIILKFDYKMSNRSIGAFVKILVRNIKLIKMLQFDNKI